MNGFVHIRQDSYERAVPQPLRPSVAPRGPVLVDSYRTDSLNGFESNKPRFNPMNSDHVQSSVLVDLKDPVQVHLLTETALSDSKQFEILSQEEVDDLKKQCQVLNQRIEQTRANLAIQSKYRDAAISMSRLYSPSRADGKRRSLLGNRHSGTNDAAREAEVELHAIQKKCEELASELWALEKRVMEPQRRLLEHTAGILQFTHRSTKKSTTPTPKVPLVNGIPASPESMYTTSNGRDSMDFLDDGVFFDEASLYRSFDQPEAFGGRALPSAIEIPLKSPVRGQNKQLAEESEKLREENNELQAQVNELRGQSSDQWRLISSTENKLENLNGQLRELIVRADPARNSNYRAAPSGRAEPGDLIGSHLDYLEKGLVAITGNQSGSGSPEVTRKIQEVNLQIQDMLVRTVPSYPPPPDSNMGVSEHLGYLWDSLQAIEDELRRAVDMSIANATGGPDTEQSESVLIGLWDMIQSGYADIRQRKQARRKARAEKGLEPDEEDMSDGESLDFDEAYSLPAFSAKIQWLYSQATKLKEQKAVLKRQIKQQRDLNSKSDSEKDEALKTKMEELEESRGQLFLAEKETDTVRTQLSDALEELERVQNGRSEESTAIDEARGMLKERNAKIASLEAESKDIQARLAAAEANMKATAAQLREANDAKSASDKALEEKEKEMKAKEEELGQMTGMFAELKMEATLAKAELDSAYGSRKERAAEAAALHNSGESAKINSRVETLERELSATAQDLTDVVKQSLASEKRIGELEAELDRARGERAQLRDERDRLRDAAGDLEERLQADIARLRRDKEQMQDELDRERLRSPMPPPLSPGGSKTTSYLTDSYRVGLRAERKKYEEQLRAEQMVRRKLEDELRAIKRAQGPGKSPLSPR
ncbi:Up-regulated during septation-domain-containing protein [Whalleya microplaca]|nr:Up-regulated during septation-domain-containing protein [Whalleya microplaca]